MRAIRYFLEKHYDAASSELAREEVSLRNSEAELTEPGDIPQSQESWWSKLKTAVRGAANSLNIKARLEALRAKCENMADKLVRWSVVFLLTTILFPIAYLWGFIKFCRYVFKESFAVGLEQGWRRKVAGADRRELRGRSRSRMPEPAAV